MSFCIAVIIMINCNGRSSQRLQKVIERDSAGKILKTFDGFVYRVYDKQSRLIELWGNPKRADFDDNFRTTTEITDSTVTTREFFFDKKNTNCKIADSLDCYITKSYHKDGKLFKTEHWNPVKNEKNKVIKHTLVETDTNPRQYEFIHYLPSYLRKNN
jgi:hypothetical protein